MMNRQTRYFPMFTDISKKKVVVVGAGTIALRRILTLSSFTEHISVIATAIHPDIRKLAEKGQIASLEERAYQREDLYDAQIVIAATDDSRLNDEIYSVCKCMGIQVNVVSDKNKCDFHFPGILLHEDVVIGINAGGRNHKKAREVREELEEFLEKRSRDEG